MKKRLIVLILILAMVGACIIIFELKLGKKITNENISDRTKEFIQSQKHDSLLENPKSNTGPTHIDKPNCYSLTIPWGVSIEREDDTCAWHYFTDKPKLNINIDIHTVNISHLDDEPGIRLRRTRSEVYVESKLKSNGREYIVFHKKSGAYEANVFYLDKNRLFVINVLSYSSENLDSQLKEILNTVELAS